MRARLRSREAGLSAAPLFIDGAGLWAPSLPGWHAARAALRGEGAAPASSRLPSAALLPAAERRRASESVVLALDVATQAVSQSGVRPDELASVFASAHGDLAINDYICRTLVEAPTLMSPTKFHNSVLNAASGYWTIATRCMRASIAVSAGGYSFGAGLLEALSQCVADARPVLLVGCDVEACGPLASTNDSRGRLAVALVVMPSSSPRSLAALDWELVQGPTSRAPVCSAGALALGTNAMADALPFFETLARGGVAALTLPLSVSLGLKLHLSSPPP